MALHNIDAEQAVLGAMLVAPSSAVHLAEMLTGDDFTNPAHRVIFEAITATIGNGGVPSFVMLSPLLRDVYINEINMTCAAYMGKLIAGAVTINDGMAYAANLREYAARRRMKFISEHMAAVAENPMANINEFNADVMRDIDDMTARIRQAKRSSFPVGSIAQDAITKLQSDAKPDVTSTGLRDLDAVIGGLHPGQIVYVAGRPSMGKTCLMLSMALQSAKMGASWLIFSLEMGREPVIHRMLSDMVWKPHHQQIPYERITRGELSDHELSLLVGAASDMGAISIEIDDQPGLSAMEIGNRSRKYAEKLARDGRKLNVIGVDHLGKVAASNRYSGNKVHETGEKSNAFAVLCKDLNVCGVIAHQLNRSNEKRDNKRPEMSDMRDSGDIEQDADVILFPYRSAYYLERLKEDDCHKELERQVRLKDAMNLMEVTVAKNRNGQCTNIEFYCDMGSNVIRRNVT